MPMLALSSEGNRWIWLLLAVVIVVVIVLPFETTVVPAWRIRAVDEAGNPIAGVNVSEHWQHYTVETRGHEELLITDENGYVSFPARSVRASILDRIVGVIRNIADTGIHVSFGPYAYIVVWKESFEITSEDYSRYSPMPEQIVLRRKQ